MVNTSRVIDTHVHHGNEKEAIEKELSIGLDSVTWNVGKFALSSEESHDSKWASYWRKKLNSPIPEIPPLTIDHLIDSMDEANVSNAVLVGWNFEYYIGYGDRKRLSLKVWVKPEWTKQCMDKYPGRFVGEVGINPMEGPAIAIKELVRGVEEFGCCGMKIFPPSGFSPDDKELCYPLYEKCIELGVHATIHINTEGFTGSRLKYCSPLNLDEVLSDFPELKVHMLHSAVQFGLGEHALSLLYHAPNLVTSCSPAMAPSQGCPPILMWGSRPDLFNLCEKVFPDQLMYGSDYPLISNHRTSIENIENMYLSEDFLQKLFCDNARRFYNIP